MDGGRSCGGGGGSAHGRRAVAVRRRLLAERRLLGARVRRTRGVSRQAPGVRGDRTGGMGADGADGGGVCGEEGAGRRIREVPAGGRSASRLPPAPQSERSGSAFRLPDGRLRGCPLPGGHRGISEANARDIPGVGGARVRPADPGHLHRRAAVRSRRSPGAVVVGVATVLPAFVRIRFGGSVAGTVLPGGGLSAGAVRFLRIADAPVPAGLDAAGLSVVRPKPPDAHGPPDGGGHAPEPGGARRCGHAAL